MALIALLELPSWRISVWGPAASVAGIVTLRLLMVPVLSVVGDAGLVASAGLDVLSR